MAETGEKQNRGYLMEVFFFLQVYSFSSHNSILHLSFLCVNNSKKRKVGRMKNENEFVFDQKKRKNEFVFSYQQENQKHLEWEIIVPQGLNFFCFYFLMSEAVTITITNQRLASKWFHKKKKMHSLDVTCKCIIYDSFTFMAIPLLVSSASNGLSMSA